jgi:hypothetical protein
MMAARARTVVAGVAASTGGALLLISICVYVSHFYGFLLLLFACTFFTY